MSRALLKSLLGISAFGVVLVVEEASDIPHPIAATTEMIEAEILYPVAVITGSIEESSHSLVIVPVFPVPTYAQPSGILLAPPMSLARPFLGAPLFSFSL
ncbi:hypothetical protein ACFE04_029046 [Oxalis oulophora]